MKHFTKQNILELEKVKRLNIINSITGIKPGNLIGTIDDDDKNTNLAIFSSVVHLGSHPALLGFILRPQVNVRRDTYNNIMSNGYYTINHLPNNSTENGHYTSAKFDNHESEFKHCKFTELYHGEFKAPFVKESPLKIGLKYLESIPIEINNTIMIVGSVEHVFIDDSALSEEGYIDLEKLNTTGIGGLNSYYKLQKIETYPYARRKEVPNFD
jgi:flavin reductase (DIM6/NTAB) family NADH-FMN oxidoreductase RutF|tara:strand:- start:708 stop:1346 length:639 start_codon:yes stop_codon:yes gene_type:complete